MGALISECGRYRYLLVRDWGDDGDLVGLYPRRAVFVMLNPSTADASTDDPTIRRCVSFAESWGCKGIAVVNLYAWRATKPADLRAAPDPVGDNDRVLDRVLHENNLIVCAWGSTKATGKGQRVQTVIELAKQHDTGLLCLGTTKDGDPRHPLYLPKTTKLERYDAMPPRVNAAEPWWRTHGRTSWMTGLVAGR